MWIRWILVQENRDQPVLHLARGAPKRWYTQPERFGLSDAPTRFGVVSYFLLADGEQVHGSVMVRPHPNSKFGSNVRYTVRLISPKWASGATLSQVTITAG